MRITAHHTAVMNVDAPIRNIPARVAPQTGSRPISTSTLPHSTSSTVINAPASPFASLFQSFSQASAASLTQAQAASSPAAITASSPAATTAASSVSGAASTSTPVTLQPTGIGALVSAIMNGTLKPTYVTDPAKLQETTPVGTDTMPNFYYASDQTAAQMAQLLGGKVVQMKAFGQDQGWTEPNANFIQLPNGMTFNAADVAYYAKCGAEGPGTLTAGITQTINQGAAWTNYYQYGGPMPIFPPGYIGPAIAGMNYPAGTLNPDGSVINPLSVPTT